MCQVSHPPGGMWSLPRSHSEDAVTMEGQVDGDGLRDRESMVTGSNLNAAKRQVRVEVDEAGLSLSSVKTLNSLV